jgi:hypothetical protein
MCCLSHTSLKAAVAAGSYPDIPTAAKVMVSIERVVEPRPEVRDYTVTESFSTVSTAAVHFLLNPVQVHWVVLKHRRIHSTTLQPAYSAIV